MIGQEVEEPRDTTDSGHGRDDAPRVAVRQGFSVWKLEGEDKEDRTRWDSITETGDARPRPQFYANLHPGFVLERHWAAGRLSVRPQKAYIPISGAMSETQTASCGVSGDDAQQNQDGGTLCDSDATDTRQDVETKRWCIAYRSRTKHRTPPESNPIISKQFTHVRNNVKLLPGTPTLRCGPCSYGGPCVLDLHVHDLVDAPQHHF